MKLEDYQFFQKNGYLSLGKPDCDESLTQPEFLVRHHL